MADIKILGTDDKKEWKELYEKISVNDIYFSPSYLETCKHIMEGIPYCFVYMKEPEKYILYPFFKRKINDLEIFSHLSEEYFDIISPYGYSGFLSSFVDMDIGEFIDVFDDYCRQENIVNEFIRFNPLIQNDKYKGIDKLELIKWSETVFIDLADPLEGIKKRFSSANKRNINKAIKNQLQMVELEYNEKNIIEFYKIYSHTMERLSATDFYYFSKEYFYSLKEELKDAVKLFKIVNSSGDNMAMLLFLGYDKYFHYHLGGSLEAYWDLRPNNLLFFRVIEWAKLHGYEKLHLGGGYKKNDNLFRFKKSFSPLTLPYFIVKRIHNRKIYDDLYRINMQYLKGKNVRDYDKSYFPAYRVNSKS